MPYYQGDYYAGDYYYGDPGLFSFIGKAAKSAIKVAKGVIGAGKQVKGLLPAKVAAPSAAGAASTGIVSKVSHIIVKHPVMSAAAGAGIATAATAGLGTMAGKAVMGKMGAPALPSGATPMHRMRMPGMAGMRRHRRMNPCNIHALRRSIRRAQSFARIAKKVLRFTSPKAPRGRAVFKHRKRAKRI